MPFQALALAWREETGSPLAKLVYLWLMNEADLAGFVSIEMDRLVLFAQTSERRVLIALRALHDDPGSGVRSVSDDFKYASVNLPTTTDLEPVKRGAKPSREDMEWVRFYSGDACFACRSKVELEIDHIIPVSQGGLDDRFNMQLLCRECNRRKRAKTGWVAMLE